MPLHPIRRSRRVAAVTAALAFAMSVAAPAAAAVRPIVDVNLHTTTINYFPPDKCGPGSTEIATGNSHLVRVDDGTMLHVQFMETFKVHTIWDDPTWPDGYRQGTDALVFQMPRSGTVIFHESFHDFGAAGWNPLGGNAYIQAFVTFVAVDGVVRVDHSMGRDLPPEGC